MEKAKVRAAGRGASSRPGDLFGATMAHRVDSEDGDDRENDNRRNESGVNHQIERGIFLRPFESRVYRNARGGHVTGHLSS